ncbi:MAG: hypothetical protein V3W19_11060 [Desulfatiglandales bacterium]
MAIKDLHPAFQHRQYLFRRKVLKLFGGAFHVYDEGGKVVLYSKMKAFKLREDLRVYSDESQREELLKIKTPKILDFGATYYVTDSTTNEEIGAISRKGLKSILKDEWIFRSTDGGEIGKLTEESMMGALLSRFISLIPQKYVILANNREIASIKRHFNPLVLKFTMTIKDPEHLIDQRLLIAAGILLAGIEGRQG